MDYEARRDPDAILRQIVEEEAAEGDTRGKLKIFFGYAAGVGKTYAMLEEAHAVLEKGFDVVVGYVEPHTRADTMALVDGLEQISPSTVQHRGISLREFDLDAVLARHPQIVLVDRIGPHERPGLPASEALPGRRGAAARRYQRVHHRERPAPRRAQ